MAELVAMAEAERMAAEFVRGRHPRAGVYITRAELRSQDHWTVWGRAVEKRPLIESTTVWVAEIEDGRVISCDFQVGAGLIDG